MAIRTGFSHSLATLLLTILSALIVHFLRHVGLFDRLFSSLLDSSLRFTSWLENSLKISIAHELFPIICIAAVLAFFWGMVFHMARNQ